MNKIGYVIKKINLFYKIIVPYHFFDSKYSKVQVKYKKYRMLDFRNEYKKGDIVYYNTLKNKIYKILK